MPACSPSPKAARGASLLTRYGAVFHARETQALQIADTVGAGDCFLAGLVAAMLEMELSASWGRTAVPTAQAQSLLANAVASASICANAGAARRPCATRCAPTLPAAACNVPWTPTRHEHARPSLKPRPRRAARGAGTRPAPARARHPLHPGHRRTAGCRKSTLAEGLVQALGARAQVVPMDGFHLANSELQRLGRAHRKGAADTFDATGYCHLLRRLRTPSQGETVYAPSYQRNLEEGIAGAIAVPDSTQLVITEGNYLLLDEGDWAKVRSLLDEAWYLDVDDGLRNQRLLARHMQFGRSRESALAWIANTDTPNALRIAASRERADWVVRVQGLRVGFTLAS